MDIALFDFDGTITQCDTFTPFVKSVIPRNRMRLGQVFLAPLIIGHRYGLVSSSYVRQKVIRVGFKGLSASTLAELGRQHADSFIPKVIRPQAIERLKWHKNRGDRILIVSASLAVYLDPWCKTMGFEVCGVNLEEKYGRLTGRYVDGDCTARKKADRIRAVANLDEYEHVYAYGDTVEDTEMLDLADTRYFNWEEVS
ncbi:HAD family hydrolase [Pseudidiomarina sp.]|uniref:HAD family hydrolase n=1 Tax=Pseudidiomarina sp. TaxID=2081707 RepID=UPI003A969297